MTHKELYSICHDEAVAYANSEQWSKRTGEEKSFLIQGYFDAIMEMRKSEITEKKKEYPKTYEECCQVLGYDDRETYCVCHTYANERLFESLYRLKVCRDAYWKLYGEEMGLGKPWEPSGNEDCFVISRSCGEVFLFESAGDNEPFEFPTREMRDAFYENFKELIEQCKELL